jgi:endonuclease/exonuclease/phosphatase (EEP) superfamily protein YafD
MRVAARIVLFLLGLILLCSVIGLLGSIWWFFDLFNHFRPQALVAALCLLAPSLVFRWRAAIAIALIAVVLNGGLMAVRMAAFSGAEDAGIAAAPVTLLSANLLASNTATDKALGLIVREQPDIVLAVEVSHPWADALKALPAAYAYRLIEPRFDVFGMAAYSRLPFTGQVIRIGERQIPLLYLDFGGFVVMAVHPPPPVFPGFAIEQALYLQEVAERVRLAGKPVIVAGDFNGTLWSESLRPLANAGLKSSHPSGLAWTWPSGFFPLAIQIDHVFVKNAAVGEFRVLPGIGSDHFPVKASFVQHPDR